MSSHTRVKTSSKGSSATSYQAKERSVPGRRSWTWREGDKAEMLAQAILSHVAFTNVVHRSEDIGVDFGCVLAERNGDFLTAGPAFTVQVKSESKSKKSSSLPKFPQGPAFEWFVRQEVPYFLGILKSSELRLDLYSTWRRVPAAYGLGQARKMSLVAGPDRRVTFDGSDERTVPLGPPLISVTLEQLVKNKANGQSPAAAVFSSVLKRWITMDHANIARARVEWHDYFGPSSKTTCYCDADPGDLTFDEDYHWWNPANVAKTALLLRLNVPRFREELRASRPGEFLDLAAAAATLDEKLQRAVRLTRVSRKT